MKNFLAILFGVFTAAQVARARGWCYVCRWDSDGRYRERYVLDSGHVVQLTRQRWLQRYYFASRD